MSPTEELLQRLTPLWQDMRDAEQTAREAYLRIFLNAARELFEVHPTLERFSWQHELAYDDQEYAFSVNLYDGSINGTNVGYLEDDPEEEDYPLVASCEIFLGFFNEEILQLLFGTTSRIELTREGIVLNGDPYV